MRTPILVLFIVCAFSGAPNPCQAAEFDLDGPRVVLRRLQYCEHCGSALLVTHVHAGTHIRCPDCGREQARLADKYLLTQLYQLCRLCHLPLAAGEHRPGDVVECANCRTRQTLSRDAVASGPDVSGLGHVPGFPPGTGEKSLLLAKTGKLAPGGPPPLDDPPALPPPPRDFAAVPIPRPPAAPLPDPGPPAAPERKPAESAPPPPESEREGPPSTNAPEGMAPAVLDVPAVTVDMFGGKRRDRAENAGAGESRRGAVLARVNGEPIYESDVSRRVEPAMRLLREQAALAAAAALEEKERALSREILERLIDRLLAVREAAALGHRADPAAVRERENELSRQLGWQPADARLEAERDVVMADMRRLVAARTGAISPEAVREYYRAHRDEMTGQKRLAISTLVVFQDRNGRPDGREYLNIAAEVSFALERGERFDELRKRYDEFGPAAGLVHGPPPLEPESAYASRILLEAGDLRRGAVFGPLFMEGMALFGKVEDVRPAGPLPFEEVEKEIRRRLESASEEETLDAWLARLRSRAKVEYYGPEK